ncbi:hypothetical protein Scep_003808 [Stephania cephalantha]|uniref:Uncharacterized protein n=1 Tax=Stephania cephalantha TaxID=152367 RepID=A0AAP0KST5_9MAGN
MCYGGIISSFLRQPEKIIDMPLNSDVCKVLHGYNAPQQFDTKYYFLVGVGGTTRQSWLDAPYTFGRIGNFVGLLYIFFFLNLQEKKIGNEDSRFLSASFSLVKGRIAVRVS